MSRHLSAWSIKLIKCNRLELKMNRTKQFILTTSLLLAFSGTAAAEFTGNVSVGTDYIYRGISQTDETATIQGGFDWAGESGLYAGVWASNLAFDGYIEMDVYAGYAGSIGEAVEYDVGLLHYDYPNQASGHGDYNFDEIYGSVSYKGITLGFAYSNDFFGESGSAEYLYAEYALDLPQEFGLGFHYGMQNIDDNDAFGAPDYDEYSVSLTKELQGFGFGLTWHDTNLSSDECFGSDLCESRVVFAVSKSL